MSSSEVKVTLSRVKDTKRFVAFAAADDDEDNGKLGKLYVKKECVPDGTDVINVTVSFQ